MMALLSLILGCSKWTIRSIRKRNVWKRIVKRKKAVGLSMREAAKDIRDITCRPPMYMVEYLKKCYQSCE